jgi:hypothetical protein
MLVASATHPAMMLSQQRGVTKDTSERELRAPELRSVDGGANFRGYAQLTPAYGLRHQLGHGFEHHPWDHYTGPVSVMGFPRQGRRRRHVVPDTPHHPSTARRIDGCANGSCPTPPPTLVDKRATVWPANAPRSPSTPRSSSAPRARRVAGAEGCRPLSHAGLHAGSWGSSPVPGHDGLQALSDGERSRPRAAHVAAPNGYRTWPTRGDPPAEPGPVDEAGDVLAAHWWPGQPRPSAADRAPPHGEAEDPQRPWTCSQAARVPHLVGGAIMRPRSLGRVRRRRAQPRHEALGWRLPYLVALILDSPYQIGDPVMTERDALCRREGAALVVPNAPDDVGARSSSAAPPPASWRGSYRRGCSLACSSPRPSTRVLVILPLRGGFDGLNAMSGGGRTTRRGARHHPREPSRAAPADAMFGTAPGHAPRCSRSGRRIRSVSSIGDVAAQPPHFQAMERWARRARLVGSAGG